MLTNIIILIIALALVIKGATLATNYSAKLAENFRLSKYIVGFIVVAFISILPETLISINSAIKGTPEFGLGTLFGSNIADLTLIFAILILVGGRNIKIESKLLKDTKRYPLFLILPLMLGLDGNYSRIDGLILITESLVFYFLVFKNGVDVSIKEHNKSGKLKNSFFLLFSLLLLLIGSHYTVTSATDLAYGLKISPILIGMLIVSLGTTMPELFFSIKSIKKRDDGLAIGDILGSVLADATLVVGIIAVISPFYFPIKIVYITGTFMLVSSLILLRFMRSGKKLSTKEGIMLLFFWFFYVIIELMINLHW
jgi:cation:H+ antiporter